MYLADNFITRKELFCHLLRNKDLKTCFNIFPVLNRKIFSFWNPFELADNLFWMHSWRKRFVHFLQNMIRVHMFDNIHLRSFREAFNTLKVKNWKSLDYLTIYANFDRLDFDVKVRVTSELNKILNFLKFFFALFNIEIHSNLTLPYGLKQTKILFIMTKVFIILNSKLSENNFMMFTFNLVISFVFISDVKSLCQEKSLSGSVSDDLNVYKNLSYSHI